MQRFMAWLTGTHPEFFDSKFVAQGEGREVTRVKNTGVLKVSFNIMSKGMENFGYGSSANGVGSSLNAQTMQMSTSNFSATGNWGGGGGGNNGASDRFGSSGLY
jgi:hypothetical protein